MTPETSWVRGFPTGAALTWWNRRPVPDPLSAQKALVMRLSDLGGVLAAGWSEVADVVRAQLAIIAAARLLRSRVSGDVVAWGNSGQQVWHSSEVERMRRLARMVIRVASHGPVRPNCLVRALAIQRLLLREGLGPGRICVGVRRCDRGLDAHAWVEVGDLILGERPARAPAFGALDPSTIPSP